MFGCLNIAVLILSSVVSGGCINAGAKWPAVDGVTTIKWCHTCKDGNNVCWKEDDMSRIQAAMSWWENNGANVIFSNQGECTDDCDDCVKFDRIPPDCKGSSCSIGMSKGAGKHSCSICPTGDSDGRLRHEIAHILGVCHEQDCFGVSNVESSMLRFAKKSDEQIVATYCNADGRKNAPAAGCAIHNGFDVTSVMLYPHPSGLLCPNANAAREQNGGVTLNNDGENDKYPTAGDIASATALYPPAQQAQPAAAQLLAQQEPPQQQQQAQPGPPRSSSEESVASMISSRFHASERASAPILLSFSGFLLLLFTLICFRVCKIKQTGSQYAELLYDDEI